MDKITLAAEKSKALLDIYQKYLNDYIELLLTHGVLYAKANPKAFSFETWFNNNPRIREYRAEKLYTKEGFTFLKQSGFEINIVDTIF